MGDYYLSDWTHKGPNAQQQMFGFYSTITFLIILASLLAYLVNYLGMIYKSLGLSLEASRPDGEEGVLGTS